MWQLFVQFGYECLDEEAILNGNGWSPRMTSDVWPDANAQFAAMAPFDSELTKYIPLAYEQRYVIRMLAQA